MFDKIGSWNNETIDAGEGDSLELPEIADFSDEIDQLSDVADFGDEDDEFLNLSEIADLDNEADEFPDLAEIADFGDEDEILDLPKIAELEDDDEFFDLPEVADLDDDDDEISDTVEATDLEEDALVAKDSEQEVVSEDTEDASETKPTRELTDDEKKMLQETLRWSEKQIAKCTIGEDGVIHYKTINAHLEGKDLNGVPYERRRIEINGILIEGVFPVFESKFDVALPEELKKSSDTEQFKYCMEQLRERIESDPEFAKQFTPRQLEQIKDKIKDKNNPRISGLTWHHNEESGKMQLVNSAKHEPCRHTGGRNLWGGGSDCR